MANNKFISSQGKTLKSPVSFRIIFPRYTATLIFLGIWLSLAVIAVAWLLGESHIMQLFNQLNYWQENPPVWVQVPEFIHGFYLYLPTIILFIFVQIIMKLSPFPKPWSRGIIVTILLILILRYFSWRSLSTLNFNDPVNGMFSLGLFLLEFIAILGGFIQLIFMFTSKERKQEANDYSQAVINQEYCPSVDVFIPTYNEPSFILKRTIIGCQALDYQHKKIYVLDDTNRPEIEQLAKELGCYYVTRPDNLYAKAGNLNHALTKTNGELIAIFDADFVPTTNFLVRTIGFFQNGKTALLQTPQHFYNPDPIARNLGLDQALNAEEEVFYRQIQLMRDGVNSVLCAGTSFVVRRSALEEVGGFVTESISEDYFTGIRLLANKYDVLYLNEKLSAGLAAESISSHISQRLRWGRGTLQAFFIKENPLIIPNLTFVQRLVNFEGLLFWFSPLSRCFFLICPFLYSVFNISFIQVTSDEFIYMFLPYYTVSFTVLYWLSLKARSVLFSDVYNLTHCFPTAINTIKVMLRPFDNKFSVTPKGVSRKRYVYQWKLAVPVIIFLGMNLISLGMSLQKTIISTAGINPGFYWSLYNVITIGVALLAFYEKPQSSLFQNFSLSKRVKIINKNSILEGKTKTISEEGATLVLNSNCNLPEQFLLEIEGLKLPSEMIEKKITNHQNEIKIYFLDLTLEQQKKLIYLLYCTPNRWQFQEYKKAPGEFVSLVLMLKLLLRYKGLTSIFKRLI
ncbi:glycosyltransferase [Crocosphaera sp. XPORK-15E]|uniref:glycosyltransferase family 2 protein n=1 Tax=Crocosphaera sp. XPORK-15E TaxID=3110247 RepID=UPI002B209286|nr:glycosyltransferase [Crocosphaera sp. XPORK-15E]MEA5533444.1 glycosyltransferase [Crocosphaera sp. XPORK-15E]